MLATTELSVHHRWPAWLYATTLAFLAFLSFLTRCTPEHTEQGFFLITFFKKYFFYIYNVRTLNDLHVSALSACLCVGTGTMQWKDKTRSDWTIRLTKTIYEIVYEYSINSVWTKGCIFPFCYTLIIFLTQLTNLLGGKRHEPSPTTYEATFHYYWKHSHGYFKFERQIVTIINLTTIMKWHSESKAKLFQNLKFVNQQVCGFTVFTYTTMCKSVKLRNHKWRE